MGGGAQRRFLLSPRPLRPHPVTRVLRCSGVPCAESLSAVRSECLQVLRFLVAAQSQHYAQPDAETGGGADAGTAGRGRHSLPLPPATLATLRLDILHHSLHAVGELLRRERACPAAVPWGGQAWTGATPHPHFPPPASLAAEAWAVGAAASTVSCLNAMAASSSSSLENLYEVACGVLESLCAGDGARSAVGESCRGGRDLTAPLYRATAGSRARTVAQMEGALGHLAEAVALMGRSSPPHRGVALPLSVLALAAHRQKGKRGVGQDMEGVQNGAGAHTSSPLPHCRRWCGGRGPP